MKETGNPLVSVIMAVYNGSAFLETAIRSVITQTYRNLELLIVNDGSEDDSEEIVLRLIRFDSRIRYFTQANEGVSAARNLGLKNMRGSYFTFLDADDCFYSESIELRMAKFKQDTNLGFCDGGVVIFDSELKIPRRYWKPSLKGFVFKRLIRLSESCFFGPTWLIKRDPSRTYSLESDMTHAEDLFFFMDLSRSGQYDFVDENILKYRISGNSAMRNLKGLANGYSALYEKVLKNFAKEISFREKFYLWLKIRKIMVMSFLAERHFLDAFHFLITGKAK